MDGYLDHAQLARFRQQAADHRAGYAQLAGYVALSLILQIIAARHIGQPLSFILTDIQRVILSIRINRAGSARPPWDAHL